MFGLGVIDTITVILFIIFLIWFLTHDFSPAEPIGWLILDKPARIWGSLLV